MFIYGAIDDLYQKNARFSKLKLPFSMRSIRLSTVVGVAQLLSRVATIRSAFPEVWRLFESGDYSRVASDRANTVVDTEQS